ncbi:MAG: 5-(carboxyamino)imidazole ribonucleotide synthase [Actinomycetota bacterium]
MRVGIIGGGQLGRMLGLAGIPLGCTFTYLDPSPEAGAKSVGELIVAPYDDDAALDRLAAMSDVVTYEFENVPADAAKRVADRVPVLPFPRSLEMTQNRAREKEVFERCGIGTPRYRVVARAQDLSLAIDDVGIPCVVKTLTEGYDGKGQIVVRSEADRKEVVRISGGNGVIVESFVPFDRELSAIDVRSRDGEVVCYPLVENLHHEGILRLSRAPVPRAQALQEAAESMMKKLLADLEHVGVLTLEMFERDGDLLANEMAPRVHNSGHWTIEGAETSQFENHVRAITGLPLGSTRPRGHSAMVNLVGALPAADAVLALEGAHLHLYDKAPRPGRKVGHVTVRADAPEDVDLAVRRLHGLAGTYLGPN